MSVDAIINDTPRTMKHQEPRQFNWQSGSTAARSFASRAKAGLDGAKFRVLACGITFAVAAAVTQRTHAQTIAPSHSSNLTISNIGGAFFNTSPANASRVTQMTFGPGPDPTKTYLYLSSATSNRAVRRVEYNPATGSFVGGLTTVSTIAGNGIAFHGNTMYLTEPYESSVNQSVSLSRLWRATDTNNDGIYETSIPIVEGIPRDDHGANQIQIRGNTLYVGLGVRTRNGVTQTFGGDAFGESAYGGSIGVIEDLTQVENSANSAGFFLANPTAAQYRDLIDGTNPIGGSPYTSTVADKLRAFASGLRNPFGVRLDGDGALWATNNFQRTENNVYTRNSSEGDAFGGDGFAEDIHDQMFKIQPKGDYGYRNANWQTDPVATNAGFFLDANRQKSFTFDNYDDPAVPADLDDADPAYNVLHVPASPVGLGPHSSSNGLDFYDGNAFPLQYHKDAFVARWNQSVMDGGQTLQYRDVVSVDVDTGKTSRIASGFVSPIDVVADPNGNLIVADYGGSLHLIRAASPTVAAHAFNWSSDANGNWSDRLSWNADSQAADDRMAPHAWGVARYAVTLDRPGANPTITLDQDTRVESVRVADRLRLTADNDLTIDQLLTVDPEGALNGNGSIFGNVSNNGAVSPGDSIGSIAIAGAFSQQPSGTLAIELGGSAPTLEYDQLLVTGNGTLAGALAVELIDNFTPSIGQAFTILTANDVNGTFTTELLPSVPGLSFDVIYNPQSVVLTVSPAFTADFDGDNDVDGNDLMQWQSDFGVNAGSDADNDGDSDGDDFLQWQRQLGSPLPATPAADAVPEPLSAGLGASVAVLLVLTRRRTQPLVLSSRGTPSGTLGIPKG
jgi:glucose/arabinose dehydrogenase